MKEVDNGAPGGAPVPGWGRGLTPGQQQRLQALAHSLGAEYDRLELVELCAAVLAHAVDPTRERSRQACPRGLRLAHELLQEQPDEREPLYTPATALSGLAVHYAAQRGSVPDRHHSRPHPATDRAGDLY